MVKRFVSAARRSDRQQVSRVRAVRPSRSIESWYRGELLALVKAFRKQAEAEILPLVDRTLSSAVATQDASFIERLQATLDRLGMQFSRVARRRADKLADTLTKRSDRQTVESLTRMVAVSFGLDLAGFLRRSPKLSMIIDAAHVANVNLIRSIPEQYLGRIASAVMQAVTSGQRFESIKDEIREAGAITERRAKFIARDQVAKLNSSINRVRQTDLGITEYTWSTSDDERVRPTHRANDGKIFSWNDAPDATGHPGEDYNCRCVAIPIIDLARDSDD